jgi:hypothetical protein
VIAINGPTMNMGMERTNTPTVTAELPPQNNPTPNEPPPTIVQRRFGSPPAPPNPNQTYTEQGQDLERSGSNLMDMDVQE